VRVVPVRRDELLQELCEVLEESRLELVDAHGAGRVRRVDAGDPVLDTALPDRVGDVLGDVGDVQSAGSAKVPLALERLHAPDLALRTGPANTGAQC
jgi:hypothetical protein